MSDFTTEKSFLFLSFGPSEEEGDRIRRFMLFLESSGVGSIIDRYVKNEGQRPPKRQPPSPYRRRLGILVAATKSRGAEVQEAIREEAVQKGRKVHYKTYKE